MLDVSEQNLPSVEQQLEQTRRELDRLRFAVDQHAIVAITDRAGKIIYVNDTFCKISQYSREELIGNDHRIVNSGFHPREVFAEMWRTITSGKVWKGEVKNRAKDGSYYWVAATIIPFLDERGRPYQYMALRTDITPLKEEQKLIASSRMAALAEMSSGISHEINNPLAILHGCLGLLRDQASSGTIDPERMFHIISKAEVSALRIQKIVKGLETFAGAQDWAAPANCQIRSAVNEAMSFCQERFRRHGINLRSTEIAPELGAHCSPSDLTQVILHLLNNSFEAVATEPNSWVRIEAKARGEQVEIAVTDSGSGIPPEIRGKIFEPLFTTKEVGKNPGLGLSIARGLVENHRGQLFYDQESAKTRFVVWLPKA